MKKSIFEIWTSRGYSPPILLRLHTSIAVHAQTAAQEQSNGNFEARMSEKYKESRD